MNQKLLVFLSIFSFGVNILAAEEYKINGHITAKEQYKIEYYFTLWAKNPLCKTLGHGGIMPKYKNDYGTILPDNNGKFVVNSHLAERSGGYCLFYFDKKKDNEILLRFINVTSPKSIDLSINTDLSKYNPQKDILTSQLKKIYCPVRNDYRCHFEGENRDQYEPKIYADTNEINFEVEFIEL